MRVSAHAVRPTGVALALGIALALVPAALTACSGTPPDAAPSPSATALDTPAPASPGLLEAYLGAAVGAQSQGEVAAELAAREEAIAACMAEQGFDYVPIVMVPGSFEVADEPLRGTREFAETYGYGVWHGPEIEPGQFTYMMDDSASRAYRESLSPAAQEAYDKALMGAKSVQGDVITFDGVDACASAAQFRGDDAESSYLVGVSAEVSAYLESLQRGDDPRLTEVDAAWASCMADAGFDAGTPYAAEWRVIEEATAAHEASPGGVPPDDAEEYAAQEHRLALSDIECREATDWAARRRAVEHELQQEYLDAHRADLDALLAAFAVAGPAD